MPTWYLQGGVNIETQSWWKRHRAASSSMHKTALAASSWSVAKAKVSRSAFARDSNMCQGAATFLVYFGGSMKEAYKEERREEVTHGGNHLAIYILEKKRKREGHQ